MRIACCVPFCRRTYANEEGFSEWVCAKHWTMTSKAWRRRRSLFKRRRRSDLADKMFARLKRQAIERAVGL
jgi:hypothetical protein